MLNEKLHTVTALIAGLTPEALGKLAVSGAVFGSLLVAGMLWAIATSNKTGNRLQTNYDPFNVVSVASWLLMLGVPAIAYFKYDWQAPLTQAHYLAALNLPGDLQQYLSFLAGCVVVPYLIRGIFGWTFRAFLLPAVATTR